MIYIKWNDRSPSGTGADGPVMRALFSLDNDRLRDAHEYASIETARDGRGRVYQVEVTDLKDDELWLQDIEFHTNRRDEFGVFSPLSTEEQELAANLRSHMEPYNIGAVLGDKRVRLRQRINQVRDFMYDGVEDFVDPATGRINTTFMAETAAYESGAFSDEEADAALDDETHWIWEIALEVTDWIENEQH